MSTNVTWNGTTYAIPAAGEVNWPSLSNFLIALGNNAAVAEEMKQAVRVATTTPVTVSDTTDCVVVTNMGAASAVAVNLPAGSTGRIFFVVDGKADAATNNITIDGNGAETINGAATYVISDNRGGVALAWNGTGWNVIARFLSGAVLTNPYSQVLSLTNTTDTSSTSTGALVVDGGIAAVKKIMAGDGLLCDGDTTAGGATALNYYRESTLVTTWTWDGTGSPGTSASTTIRVTRVGRLIQLGVPAATATTGTNSANLNTNSMLETWARPSQSTVIPISIIDNGTSSVGILDISSSGALAVRKVTNAIFTNTTTGGSVGNMLTAIYFI